MDTLLIVFVTAAVLLPVLIYHYRRRNEATVTFTESVGDVSITTTYRGPAHGIAAAKRVHDAKVADNQREVADNPSEHDVSPKAGRAEP